MSLLTLNKGTKFYTNGTQSFPKSPALPNHCQTTDILISAEVASILVSNVYERILFNFPLCSLNIFLP